jgi:hypothetical protein
MCYLAIYLNKLPDWASRKQMVLSSAPTKRTLTGPSLVASIAEIALFPQSRDPFGTNFCEEFYCRLFYSHHAKSTAVPLHHIFESFHSSNRHRGAWNV